MRRPEAGGGARKSLGWLGVGLTIACNNGLPPAQSASAGASAGQAAAAPNVRAAMVASELWKQVDAAADPFVDRPPLVDCPLLAAQPEILSGEPALGVETGECNYITALQTSRRDVSVGDQIIVRLAHFALTAPDPGEAHAAVMIDGLLALDERVAIPQPGGVLVARLRAERAIPAGAPVYFHLHNHGANSWALVEISAGP